MFFFKPFGGKSHMKMTNITKLMQMIFFLYLDKLSFYDRYQRGGV